MTFALPNKQPLVDAANYRFARLDVAELTIELPTDQALKHAVADERFVA